MTEPRPKQSPRGAVRMGLSLPVTDRRARRAERHSTFAAWLAVIAWFMALAALLAPVVAR